MTIPTSTVHIYRDATFSEATRNQLVRARDNIAAVAKDVSPEAAVHLNADIHALTVVIARWDANDATEIVMNDDGTWSQEEATDDAE